LIRFFVTEFVRKVSLLCFIWLPYGRVKRVGKVDLSGHVLLAPTHNNFYCDITVAGNEAEHLPGWMAKVGLFSPPFGAFLRYLGARPIVRILDAGKTSGGRGDLRRLNESSFEEIIVGLKQAGVFCIFPEGNSMERPGLGLPLKAGIAQLALRAEAAANFSLGLRIVPLAIEYPALWILGGNVVATYGNQIRVADWKLVYADDPKLAVKEIIAKLSEELLRIYPNFSTMEERRAADLLFLASHKLDRKRISDGFHAKKIERKIFDNFLQEADSVFARAYIYGRGGAKKIGRLLLPCALLASMLLFPFAVFSLVHNSLAAMTLRFAIGRISNAVPDHMTLRVALAILCLPFFYACQFFFLREFAPNGASGVLGYFAYSAWAILAWKLTQVWSRFACVIFYFCLARFPRMQRLEAIIRLLEQAFGADRVP
jgi:1-acyl-sn-glycerol-3-phosphate acyltransferase